MAFVMEPRKRGRLVPRNTAGPIHPDVVCVMAQLCARHLAFEFLIGRSEWRVSEESLRVQGISNIGDGNACSFESMTVTTGPVARASQSVDDFGHLREH